MLGITSGMLGIAFFYISDTIEYDRFTSELHHFVRSKGKIVAQETENRREALAELAQDSKARSYTAQIRDLYDVIENALDSGVSRTVIHQKLVDTGLAVSLRHFDQALYRIRKSHKRAGRVNPPLPEKNDSATVSIPALLNGEKTPPRANIRQSMKQIREEVENTNWAEVISDANRTSKP
ncbi:hypothetical protein YA0079_16665 [Pseudomonas syringae]|uniref:hypothetical protein n=1 Tax=Pseudomonas syringae TaxID=317 RepID=UPI0018E600AF|nr:hypothetical protein [Pseudomonas syringae]MBI6746859.1 hypothetical protein [Pseudomonas syringae]MBI6795279.1 hypothetical protein [Pseudomonas syringae]